MNIVKQKNICYTCDAAGIKLRKTAGSITTDYVGNFIYEDNLLKYIITDYGKINLSYPKNEDTVFTRQYNLTDHLGNVRVTFNVQNNNTADIVQEDSYYPFGMTMNGLDYRTRDIDKKNLYLYNGKELQEDFGLDWYDYGARFYDAQLARFHTVDPKAEELSFQSLYVYANNNPILFVDLNGENAWEPNGDGTWTAQKGDGAWSLAKDAGITFKEAKKILANTKKDNSLGNMGTYIDPVDRVEKSAVDEGDVVDVNSKDVVEEKKTTNTLTEIIKNNNLLEKTSQREDKALKQVMNAKNEVLCLKEEVHDALAERLDNGRPNFGRIISSNYMLKKAEQKLTIKEKTYNRIKFFRDSIKSVNKNLNNSLPFNQREIIIKRIDKR